MSQALEFVRQLRTAAWRTSGARYNAARRLRRRDWFATFSVAIFSIGSAALAIIERVYRIEPDTPLDNYATTVSILLGMFVVAISLIEWGANNAGRAEMLHLNAEQLNEYHRKVAEMIAAAQDYAVLSQAFLTDDLVTRLREEYEDIKRHTHYNHDPVDEDRFRARHRLSVEFSGPEAKMGWWEAQFVRLVYLLQPLRYFLVLWAVIILLLYCSPWSQHS